MSAELDHAVPITRRAFLAASGALVVGIAVDETGALAADSVKPSLTPDQLDSYLAVEPDGTVVVFYGRIDGGQGLETSIAQMVAEEIDVPFDRVRMVISDTARTVNMGGASGALGISRSGMHLRSCAAEARRLLIAMAERPLGVSAERLTVTDGVVHVAGDPAKKISYSDLIGGRYFNAHLNWNGQLGTTFGRFRTGQAETARRF
jgi:CO/xanthine dehydrogenase Mo-binding subunit